MEGSTPPWCACVCADPAAPVEVEVGGRCSRNPLGRRDGCGGAPASPEVEVARGTRDGGRSFLVGFLPATAPVRSSVVEVAGASPPPAAAPIEALLLLRVFLPPFRAPRPATRPPSLELKLLVGPADDGPSETTPTAEAVEAASRRCCRRTARRSARRAASAAAASVPELESPAVAAEEPFADISRCRCGCSRCV